MCWLTWLIVILLPVLPLLWFTSHSFKYYAKFMLYTIWIMFTACVFIPVFLVRPMHIQNMWLTSVWLHKSLWVFGLKVEVRNKSNLEYDKPCVVVCNHQSIIDVVGMMSVFPRRTTALAKRELLYCGPFGLASYLAGMIFVDRSNREKAHMTVQKTADIMRTRNVNVWIFPEGTRSSAPKLLPFKKGAFHLAIQAQVPIFPVVVSSYRDFMSRDERIFNSGKVIVTCLPRIETTGVLLDSIDELVSRVHDTMESVFLATSTEVHVDAVCAGRSILNKPNDLAEAAGGGGSAGGAELAVPMSSGAGGEPTSFIYDNARAKSNGNMTAMSAVDSHATTHCDT